MGTNGKRYADIEAVQNACTGISANELKHTFVMLLDSEKGCIEAEEDYFEKNK